MGKWNKSICIGLTATTTIARAAPPKPVPQRPEITEIHFSRLSEKYKQHEGYKAIFYWNGAALLQAREGLKYKGAYAGRIPAASFPQFAKLVMNANFGLFPDGYYDARLGSDIERIDVIRSGKSKTIYVGEGSGSPEIQQLLAALRREVESVHWKFQHKLFPVSPPAVAIPIKAPTPLSPPS